jgi:hypothetical protein
MRKYMAIGLIASLLLGGLGIGMIWNGHWQGFIFLALIVFLPVAWEFAAWRRGALVVVGPEAIWVARIALLVLAGLKAVAWVVGFLLVASMTYEVIAYRRGGLVATTQREKSAYRLGWLAWFVLMFAIAAIVQRMVH